MQDEASAIAPSTLPADFGELGDLRGTVVAGEGRNLHYRFERPLGEGAQASIWLASRLSRPGTAAGPVVLKVLRPSLVGSAPELSRLVFRKEMVALARLAERVPPTPFVVGLLDHGEVSWQGLGLPWLALEYVPGGALGGNLAARMDEELRATATAFAPERARRLLGCLVAGLSALHELRVIHRDLKPSNVLVCGVGDSELAKVADLGAARPIGMKATFDANVRVGEPGFTAPEQHHDARVGTWSDVFSLAAVTYFVLTGEAMFAGSRPVALARAFQGDFDPLVSRPRLHPAWKTSDLASGIEDVLRRATRRVISERTATVRSFWDELTPWLARAVLADAGRSSRVVCKATLESAKKEPWTFQCVAVEHDASAAPPVVRASAFDPDGHGIAAFDRGLAYWGGVQWIPMLPPPRLRSTGLRDLVRLGPVRWLAVGEQGDVACFTPTQCETPAELDPAGPTFRRIGVLAEPDRATGGVFMVLGSHGDRGWVYPFDGQRWLPPETIQEAHLQDICRVDSETALVAASHGDGSGSIWSLRLGRRPKLTATLTRAASALASTQGGAVAVCSSGEVALLDAEGKLLHTERACAMGPLTAVAEDSSGILWAATRGALLRRARSGAPWQRVFEVFDLRAPIVKLTIASGILVALASDGTVITGHQTP